VKLLARSGAKEGSALQELILEERDRSSTEISPNNLQERKGKSVMAGEKKAREKKEGRGILHLGDMNLQADQCQRIAALQLKIDMESRGRKLEDGETSVPTTAEL